MCGSGPWCESWMPLNLVKTSSSVPRTIILLWDPIHTCGRKLRQRTIMLPTCWIRLSNFSDFYKILQELPSILTILPFQQNSASVHRRAPASPPTRPQISRVEGHCPAQVTAIEISWRVEAQVPGLNPEAITPWRLKEMDMDLLRDVLLFSQGVFKLESMQL